MQRISAASWTESFSFGFEVPKLTIILKLSLALVTEFLSFKAASLTSVSSEPTM
jgi:hypothetical protein